MAVDQLPARIREFTDYLDGLLARLDQGGGWCGVFWQRDPDGMRACLDGREVPPWDVVEALLQDLAAAYGPEVAGQEKERARGLHAAALAAYDARPGGRDALGDRLDVMLREQRYAAERQAELSRSLAAAATREEADALRLDLAWARDDHERATARCAELRARMAELDRRAQRVAQIHREHAGFRTDGRFRTDGTQPGGPGPAGTPGHPHDRDVPPAQGQHRDQHAEQRSAPADAEHAAPYGERPGPDQAGGALPDRPSRYGARPGADGPGGAGGWDETRRAGGGVTGLHERPAAGVAPGEHTAPRPEPPFAGPQPDPAPVPKQRKRRRGGARFAGMAEEEAAPVAVPPVAAAGLPAPAPATGRTPRGARFAGAAEGTGAAGAVEPAETIKPAVTPVATSGGTPEAGERREVLDTVETLARLRSEGRSGEAHALLVEVAYWPAARFPLLAAEMRRAGLGADWATLLWEAASLPADRLVAAADALSAAGRPEDGQQILRQGVVRPAHEIGEAVLELVAEGRRREVQALLDAYVRVRTPEEAARSAEPGPQQLVPLLLEAARGVTDERYWDLVHALRVAGFSV
ncbi:hypothetical protein [Streptomyces bullii]|uniref:UL36 very large tegument protein n=1 Tax=Streptomyces bullii TaxID=349910 RepID=A0ABW0USZ6_9ACTN